jgi:hypothetical protein
MLPARFAKTAALATGLIFVRAAVGPENAISGRLPLVVVM